MVFISNYYIDFEVEPLQGSGQIAYFNHGLHPRLFELDPVQGFQEAKV